MTFGLLESRLMVLASVGIIRGPVDYIPVCDGWCGFCRGACSVPRAPISFLSTVLVLRWSVMMWVG